MGIELEIMYYNSTLGCKVGHIKDLLHIDVMGGWYWFAIIVQHTRIDAILECLDKFCLGFRIIFP